jgi:hypothetical protein
MLEGPNSNPTDIMIILFVFMVFVMAYYSGNRKKVKLVVNGSDIECSLNNDKRSIVGTDIVNVEGKQNPMQEINKAGDIKITINPGGVNEGIELNDIADYDMSL